MPQKPGVVYDVNQLVVDIKGEIFIGDRLVSSILYNLGKRPIDLFAKFVVFLAQTNPCTYTEGFWVAQLWAGKSKITSVLGFQKPRSAWTEDCSAASRRPAIKSW